MGEDPTGNNNVVIVLTAAPSQPKRTTRTWTPIADEEDDNSKHHGLKAEMRSYVDMYMILAVVVRPFRRLPKKYLKYIGKEDPNAGEFNTKNWWR